VNPPSAQIWSCRLPRPSQHGAGREGQPAAPHRPRGGGSFISPTTCGGRSCRMPAPSPLYGGPHTLNVLKYVSLTPPSTHLPTCPHRLNHSGRGWESLNSEAYLGGHSWRREGHMRCRVYSPPHSWCRADSPPHLRCRGQ